MTLFPGIRNVGKKTARYLEYRGYPFPQALIKLNFVYHKSVKIEVNISSNFTVTRVVYNRLLNIFFIRLNRTPASRIDNHRMDISEEYKI